MFHFTHNFPVGKYSQSYIRRVAKRSPAYQPRCDRYRQQDHKARQLSGKDRNLRKRDHRVLRRSAGGRCCAEAGRPDDGDRY